jgi:PAS domain S-box-containing protein
MMFNRLVNHPRLSSGLSLPGRYLVALLFVAIALGLNSLPPARPVPFMFFFGAVALTARLAGFAPAVFATLLSAFVSDYFLVGPGYTLSFAPADLFRVFCFVLVCILITSLAKEKSVFQRVSDENRNRLAAIVESSDDAIYSKTLNGTITSWNRGAESLYGYKAEEIIGKDVSVLAPDLPGEVEDILRSLQAGKRIEHRETHRFAKDGRRIEVSVSISPVYNSDGNIIGAASIARDITARKLAEQQIEAARLQAEAAEKRLRFAQQAANLGAWEWNIKSNEMWWSERIGAMHGVADAPAHPTLEDWIALAAPESREKVQLAIQNTLMFRKDYNVEYSCVFPDESVHWIVARGQVSLDANGNPQKMAGIAVDITERKLGEEALRRTEKLAAAGRLAATIAHEINNPLEAVTNLLYLLRKNPSLDEKARQHLSIAEIESERVAHITKQTLGFYREHTSPVPIVLSQAMDGILSLYERKIESRAITVRKEYKDQGTSVVALEGEIRQVFSNLIVNAVDAMELGGKLRVRIHPSCEWGNSRRLGVTVVVCDNGSGITAEHRKKIFEPFFTTKKDVGTGLGLWLSSEIVHKHGGALRLRSRATPGSSGTVFSVFLPCSNELASAKKSA